MPSGRGYRTRCGLWVVNIPDFFAIFGVEASDVALTRTAETLVSSIFSAGLEPPVTSNGVDQATRILPNSPTVGGISQKPKGRCRGNSVVKDALLAETNNRPLVATATAGVSALTKVSVAIPSCNTILLVHHQKCLSGAFWHW